MSAAVITFNLLLAAFNFYLAWNFWRLGRGAANLHEGLHQSERRLYLLLSSAGSAVSRGRQETDNLRQQYWQLSRQLGQLRQILSLLTFLLRLWRGQGLKQPWPRTR